MSEQTPRAWFHNFSSFLLYHGLVCSHADLFMSIARTDSHILVLLLHVHDIVLTCNSEAMVHKFIDFLSEKFAMKDPGDLHYFLGIWVVNPP